MINKKGAEFALEQLIQLVIAILAIIIMITIITRISSCDDTQELQAKGLLDKIIQNTSNMKEGESSSFILTAPLNWRIVSFDKSHNENTKDSAFTKPGNYFGYNVLCICRAINIKECKVCIATELPFKQENDLVNIKIQISELNFTKTKEQINVTQIISK